MDDGTVQGGASSAVLYGFVLYVLAVFVLAGLSHRVLQKRKFISEYFLGSRSLGMWAFALTFAATNASGGSFIGFPSRIYTHGWVLAFWIASYMVVPIVAMGLLGKRLNQVARKTGAVTVPEVVGERFASPSAGLTASLLLLFFMFFYLLVQFKAGSMILGTVLSEVEVYQDAVVWVAAYTTDLPWIGQSDPDYLLCLGVFAGAVILYTAYGGFRAVVWTDVMQGLVMVAGVMIMLWFTLSQVGGLQRATVELGKMTPPEPGEAVIELAQPQSSMVRIRKGTWLEIEGAEGRGIIRTARLAFIEPGATESRVIPILKITTPEEIARIQPDQLSVPVRVRIVELNPYEYGAGKRGVYIHPPGPDARNDLGFLSFWMGLSFFVFWAFGGAGQPGNMVRLMAFNSTATLRRAIALVAVYYSLIYFPLVIIFCCARVLFPGMEIDSDRVMPEVATLLTAAAGKPWLAGLLVAAPFAAVMSSVDSFLLMVSSALVRDIYQRRVNPGASEIRIKKLTYTVTVLVGVAATIGALNPPEYLQDLNIFATSGLAASFLVPILLGLYWPRMNGPGAIAGMLGGGVTHLVLYVIGYFALGRFTVYQLFGVQPFIWDLLGSFIAAISVALLTAPPRREIVRKFFQKE